MYIASSRVECNEMQNLYIKGNIGFRARTRYWWNKSVEWISQNLWRSYKYNRELNKQNACWFHLCLTSRRSRLSIFHLCTLYWIGDVYVYASLSELLPCWGTKQHYFSLITFLNSPERTFWGRRGLAKPISGK